MRSSEDTAFALYESGHLTESEDAWREILARKPQDPDALHMLGYILANTGRVDQGLALLDRAVQQAPRVAGIRSNRAQVLHQAGRIEEAERDVRRALDLEPRLPAALCLLGNIRLLQQRAEEATVAYRRALALDQRMSLAHVGLGAALLARGDAAGAQKSFEAALATDAQSGDAMNTLGLQLHRAGRYREAIALYERAAASRPAFGEPLVNWGNSLQEEGALDAARERYEEAERVQPELTEARYARAQVALRQHRFAEGWAGTETRFDPRVGFSATIDLGLPRLTAGNLIDARRVAVLSEQGLGDQVLYSTLLPEVEQRGIEVVAEVDSRLLSAYARSLPTMKFVAIGSGTAAFSGCDHQIPVASLPGIFRPTIESFSAQAQALLKADDARTAQLRAELGPGPWIAISWRSLQTGERRGLAERKSLALESFAHMDRAEGARLLDLQYGDVSQERDEFNRRYPGLLMTLPLDARNDLEGVMAALAACDHVLTSSNALAHLAGALGRPTTLLLPEGRAHFHYWIARADGRSLWYPSVEIVRA